MGCVSPILSNCGDVGAIFHLIALHDALRGFLAIGDKQQASDHGADCNKDSHVFEAFVQGLLVGSLNGAGFFIDGGKERCLKIGKSYKMTKLAYFWAAGYYRRSCSVIGVIPCF